MDTNELSLLEVAKNLVTENKGPMPLSDLIKKAISVKGLELSNSVYASLYLDIVVNGAFFLTTVKGVQMIDLKNRQALRDLETDDYSFDEDEEVIKNELREDNMGYGDGVDEALNQLKSDEQDDDDEELEETDEIAEELGLVDADDTSEDEILLDDDDEEEEEDDDDLESIRGEVRF